MKKNYLKFKGLLVLALFLSVTSHAQLTYTFAYTGAIQTLTLPVGVWGIKCWAADGGSITSLGGGGKGGLSQGVYNVTTSGTLLNILVGGKGFPATGTSASAGAGGWNGGGGGAAVGRSGGGGGGATDIRVGGTGALNRIIVAGGGGGAAYYGSTLMSQSVAVGGNGGGAVGANGDNIASSGAITTGGGGAGANGASPGLGSVTTANGTNTGGGGGGSSAGSSIGQPGTGGGQGGSAGPSSSGSTGSAGGGGGGYAGGAGGVQTSNAGVAGGGGSAYLGGVTSGSTAMFGATGYTNCPDVTGNGFVIITELCNISLVPSTSNTLNPSICAGQSVTLTTSAVSNYSWSTGASTSSVVVSPSVTTAYTLTATSASNCTTSRVLTVTVSNGLPSISVTSSTNQACLGQTATLTASGALSYTWNNGVTNGVGFTPTVTSSYSVIGQNGCGTGTAITTISVAPLPVTLIASPTVVCAGNTASLNTASAANSYTWFPVSNTTGSMLVSPQVNTIYTVIASDGTCAGVATVAVNALPIPTIVVTPTLTSLCSGLPVNLSASGALSYTWSVGSQTGSAITVTPNIPTNYQVVGTNSFGCTSAANAVVIALASPSITLLANKSLVCSGDPVDITASGATTYTWSNSSNNNSITVNPTSNSIYTVTGSTSGCSTTETIAISVFIPTLSISGNTAVCSGGSATLSASQANTYNWSNGFTTAGILVTPSVNTIYSLTALTTSAGVNCPSAASIQVNVLPNPTVTAVASRSAMCKGESNSVSASGATSYSWSTGASTASFAVTSSLVTTYNYSVVGIGSNACSGTASVQVKVNACTGLNELSQNNDALIVYPNPSAGDFKIQSQQAIELKLMNALGQLVQNLKLDESNHFEMHVSGLSNGVYFVSGISHEKEINQKIVVSK